MCTGGSDIETVPTRMGLCDYKWQFDRCPPDEKHGQESYINSNIFTLDATNTGSDESTIVQGKATVTPLQLEMTANELLGDLATWSL